MILTLGPAQTHGPGPGTLEVLQDLHTHGVALLRGQVDGSAPILATEGTDRKRLRAPRLPRTSGTP